MNEDFYSTSWSPLQKMLAKATLNLLFIFKELCRSHKQTCDKVMVNQRKSVVNPLTLHWVE